MPGVTEEKAPALCKITNILKYKKNENGPYVSITI